MNGADLRPLTDALGRAGARLDLVLPNGETVAVGAPPARARVVFRDEGALAPLLRARPSGRSPRRISPARVDVEGDMRRGRSR